MRHNLNESVAAEIRAELGRQAITQRRLAELLGWHQSMLSRRLKSQIAFSTIELEQIAHALGVAPEELTSPRAAAS